MPILFSICAWFFLQTCTLKSPEGSLFLQINSTLSSLKSFQTADMNSQGFPPQSLNDLFFKM